MRDLELPLYTEVKVMKPSEDDSGDLAAPLAQMLLDGGDDTPPNKHEQLFIGKKHGPNLHIYLIRLHLLVQAIYYSVVWCFFIPYAFVNYNVLIASMYTLIACLPIPIQFLGLYSRLIIELSHVACTGLLKHKDTEREIIREQKLKKVMGLMVLFAKVHIAKMSLKRGKKGDPEKGEGGEGEEKGDAANADELMADPEMRKQIDEISRVYDKHDPERTDAIELDKLKPILSSFGISMSDFDLQILFAKMDADHSGTISKQELIDWRINPEGGEIDMEEVAKELFEELDVDHSGEVSKEEFQQGLMKFNEEPYNAQLTDVEVIAISNEIDEDGDGTVSLEELIKLLTTET